LKKGELPDGFNSRDVYRRQWSNLGRPELAEAAIAELVARYWLKDVQPEGKPTGRPPSPAYLINPKIYPGT
jgi:hypothetical protein